MDDKNPEKIPLNPVQDTGEKKTLYEAKDDAETIARRQALDLLTDKKPQHTTLPVKQNLILFAMLAVMALIAYLIGRLLFRNGLV